MTPFGQIVFSSEDSPLVGTVVEKKEINLNNLANGIYFIEIKSENRLVKKKIIVAK